MKAYNTGIIVLSNKMIVSSQSLKSQEEIEYVNLININIDNKAELLTMLNSSAFAGSYIIFFVTMLIYLFVVYAVSNLVDAIILGTLGYLFARIVKLRLKYKATFNIGAYALTLPIILNLIYILINTFTGFEIRYFQWMYTSISYIYVVVAILMIKTEIINQRIQLIKLKEIQEQAALEAEEETPKEKQEKKEDKKENKEEKDGKEKLDGEETEGSNA